MEWLIPLAVVFLVMVLMKLRRGSENKVEPTEFHRPRTIGPAMMDDEEPEDDFGDTVPERDEMSNLQPIPGPEGSDLSSSDLRIAPDYGINLNPADHGEDLSAPEMWVVTPEGTGVYKLTKEDGSETIGGLELTPDHPKTEEMLQQIQWAKGERSLEVRINGRHFEIVDDTDSPSHMLGESWSVSDDSRR